MDAKKLKRANKLNDQLIPAIDSLFDGGNNLEIGLGILGNDLSTLVNNDSEFREKFNALLSETKNRLEKEFKAI